MTNDEDHEVTGPLSRIRSVWLMSAVLAVFGLVGASCGSSSEQVVTVPDVVGETTEFASGIITGSGLDYKIDADPSDDAAPGRIVSQIPEAGSAVEPGSVIKLFEAAPPTTTTTSISTSTTTQPPPTTAVATTTQPPPTTSLGMWDSLFLEVLHTVDPSLDNVGVDDDLLELGYEICRKLDSGVTPESLVLQMAMRLPEGSVELAGQVMGGAWMLCQEHTELLRLFG